MLDSSVQRAVQARSVEAALSLAANPLASAEARAIVRARLLTVKAALLRMDTQSNPVAAYLAARIDEFERDPGRFTPAKPIAAPPGMPIGDEEIF